MIGWQAFTTGETIFIGALGVLLTCLAFWWVLEVGSLVRAWRRRHTLAPDVLTQRALWDLERRQRLDRVVNPGQQKP
jgi:hypothetical protein